MQCWSDEIQVCSVEKRIWFTKGEEREEAKKEFIESFKILEGVKKINQTKKLEPVLKKEKPIRGRKIKMQQGLNDRSFVLLLRKLLVALKD